MKTVEYEIQQGDLLLVTLTNPGKNRYFKPLQKGWLCVTEVSSRGEVMQGNFMVIGGGDGFGGMLWPKFRRHALLRFKHGETSPYAALKKLEKRTKQCFLKTSNL